MPFASFGQNSFKQAFIVKNTGDTVKGYIEEGYENKISETVTFKKDMSQRDAQYLTVADVVAFGFDGGNTFKKVTYTDPADGQKAASFAKFLVSGYYKLYDFLKNDKRFFIIVTPQDSTYLLYEDEYSSTGAITLSGNYKNVLMFVASGCEKFRKRAEDVNYSEGEVLDFINKVNNCVSPSTQNEVLYKKPKGETHVFVYAGGFYIGSDYDVTGRIMAKFTLPSVDKRLALNVGVNFMAQHKNEKFYYSYSGAVSSTDYKTALVSTQFVSVPLAIQYYLATGKLRPYVEAGLSFLSSKISGELSSNLSTVLPETDYTGISLVGAVGVDYVLQKHLIIKAEWRYEYVLHYPTLGVAFSF
jgi:hypothetical protein